MLTKLQRETYIDPPTQQKAEECKNRFTLSELRSRSGFFSDYVSKNGKKTTEYSLLRSFYYYTGLKKTHQEEANQVIEAINTAAQKAETSSNKTPIYVLDALYILFQIYLKMKKNNDVGTVYDQIKMILDIYRIPLDEKEFNTENEKVINILKKL